MNNDSEKIPRINSTLSLKKMYYIEFQYTCPQLTQSKAEILLLYPHRNVYSLPSFSFFK